MTTGLKWRKSVHEVGWGFHDLLICSGVFLMLRWMMLKKVLREVAS
jgi:hypothetical protein